MTEKELAEMLRRNPELQVDDSGLRHTNATTVGDDDAALLGVRPGPNGGLCLKFTEHDLQAAVFAECDMRSILMPELSLLMAIPNGQYRKGQRPEPGMMPGAFDMFLPVPSGQFHGLWIELKVGSNKPSRAQLEFMRRMQHQGYRCEVIWDSVAAVMDVITDYLEG